MILSGVTPVGGPDRGGNLIIRQGRIEALPEAAAPSGSEPGELVIEMGNALVFPGLINSHDHLDLNLFAPLGAPPYRDYLAWAEHIQDHFQETIAAVTRVPKSLRRQWGLLKNLVNGVTTVVDHGGARPPDWSCPSVFRGCQDLHSIRFERAWRLKLNLPWKRLPVVMHLGEGSHAGMSAEIDSLTRWNLLKKRLVAVHGVAMSAMQAQRFSALIWCPASNQFLLGKTADVAVLKRHTRILFGTDSTLSADWNLWNQLRLARGSGSLRDDELFASITHGAARSWGLAERARLEVGARADLVFARGSLKGDLWNAFYALEPRDLLLILKGGRIVLFDADLGERLALDQENRATFSLARVQGRRKYIRADLDHLRRNTARYHPGLKIGFLTEPELPSPE